MGLKRYFTGKICSNGHISERYIAGSCVECTSNQSVKWRMNNPEKTKYHKDKWREFNPEKDKESRQKSCKNNIGKFRKYKGLPEPTRDMPEACEICGLIETRKHYMGTVSSLCLDHCHESGKFRGWVCSRCNLTLGRVNDSAELLELMAQYIRKNKDTIES